MSKRPLPALTGIRFFLALWVVIYHYGPSLEPLRDRFPSLISALTAIHHTGYSAVTAFFVLSGFILAYNYSLEQPFSPQERWRFATARFARIYPAYLCGLLLVLPFALYRLWANIHLETPIAEWGSFLLNLLLLQAWLPTTPLTWNYPGWSLSNEAFFYLCFPFIGVRLWNIRRTTTLWITFVLIWGLACAGPLIAIWTHTYHWWDVSATGKAPSDVSIWSAVVRYNPLLRLPEFCAGIVLAKIYARLPVTMHGRGTWISSLGFLSTLALLVEADHIPYPLFHNGLLVPLYAAVILGLALGGGLVARWLSSSTLLLLGNASYSLYILHAPLFQWSALFSRYIVRIAPFDLPAICGYLVFMILASCAFFKIVEEPAHRRLRSYFVSRRPN